MTPTLYGHPRNLSSSVHLTFLATLHVVLTILFNSEREHIAFHGVAEHFAREQSNYLPDD